jgi:FkbM family methyltransferase
MNIFWLKVLRKLGVSKILNVVGTRTVLGEPVKFPICGKLGWEYVQDAEGWMTSLLNSLKPYFKSQDSKAFLDVGVNVGQTLVKYRSVVPGGTYYGFEPNPVCVAYVSSLIDLNAWTDASLYPVGISKTATICELIFFHGSVVDSSASIIDEFRPNDPVAKRSNIAVFPLRAIQLSHQISFVKIDVEGAELEVLKGSEELLRRDQPLISTEILPCYDATNEFRIQRQIELETFLRSVGYECTRIVKDGDTGFAGLKVVDEIGVHADMNLSDYLWIPREQLAGILKLTGKCEG